MRGSLEPARQPATRRRGPVQRQPVRRRGDLSGLHPDGAVPGGLRQLQSARLPRSVRRGVAVLEAAVRLPHDRGSHLDARLHREAVPRLAVPDRA